MESLGIIVGVLLLGAIIQEQINSNKIKRLEEKLNDKNLVKWRNE